MKRRDLFWPNRRIEKNTSPVWDVFFRLDEKKAVKSKSWQQYIRNDPLMYHGGYKFGPAQVFINLNISNLKLGAGRRRGMDSASLGRSQDAFTGAPWCRG